MAYLLNLCDQPVTVSLNGAGGPGPIPPLSSTGKSSAPYTVSAIGAPRVPNPQPFQQFALGSGPQSSTNTLTFYLGDDVTDIRKVTISLTQDDLHLGEDCQVFLFYQSAVLRFAGNARFYPSNQQPMEA
jgi:hypothetical protein